jgi:hypothetical protein
MSLTAAWPKRRAIDVDLQFASGSHQSRPIFYKDNCQSSSIIAVPDATYLASLAQVRSL